MEYFTIIHILVMAIVFIFFIGMMILIRNEQHPKVFWGLTIGILSASIIVGTFGMFLTDTYTKKATIENITHKRVLLTESIVFMGQIRNTGKFDIGTCKLEVKLVNNPLSAANMSSSSLFNPMNLFRSKNDQVQESSTLIREFIVAKNLRKAELRNFSVSMPFPSNFSQISTFQKLNCY